MKNTLLILATLLSFSFPLSSVKAADYAYFGFEPAIITNYVAVKKKLGYVRLTVELMIEDSANYETVEHHAPLLRDAIIAIIGQQPEAKVKSINGRHEIQRLCEEKVKSLLTQETGQPLIKKLLFTQWLDN
ncbi:MULTISPECIES: flagellar basal body-associated protein FliL [unclassified Colwellia]|jgi:flagellar FliL protein|uniref:flagellar basal body-associated protein FliL n=1 Tax=unclassified Colwellia TaxID=196834 RepID=UPI0015F538E3|nr:MULTISPECIES: flagellar basal body-associated protein FliL [unclassified Colwellia]MBA6364996.1 flagellar basal body-associated protein FliL [Colwellia sp. BRX8-8]MBA6336346.1 flagellar basal body-associated protein FliL [Colwellia sp. BRX8-7]MBA6348371.1 flagellar basal body-associated protein FliL [Colwellia sp. BRX8-9]MBA6352596.1 flagellar basal body-associated protein FliL [Colwellia sp. BRX9-1]MBA6355824.1 flagellar basal body-associated protein FliL [Colwellia sp. BRX8-3]|tara:strand:+ start:3941 stop:4333 length:393 start_codon:yes stop_codon:yes gene_type:complete